jgi:hypothetical protein
MQSPDQAAMRTNLALGDAATKNTGATAGTVAAGDDSRITGALQTSGGTMTGKLTAAADNTIAKLSVGARTTGSSPTALADGDIWISNQGALSYRDSTGPTSRAVAATSLSNTFNQPQTIGSTANAGAVLSVSNSGTREVVTISNTATSTSDAVVITNLGSGNSLVVNDETTPDSTRFAVANNGRVGIGVAPDASVALTVDSTGIKFSDNSVQTTAGLTGTVGIANGGTGQTTASAAINALLPSQAGNSGKVLSTDGTNTSWTPAFKFSNTKVVGVDAATIQGCIDLVSSPTALTQVQVLIPPGVYNENLTLKPCVSLASTGLNNGQSSIVRINGTHTLTGGTSAGDNIIQLNGLRMDYNASTSPTLTISATGTTPLLVHIQDCMIGNSNASTSSVGVLVNQYCSLRCNNVKSLANSTSGSGGTHVEVNGGTFYGDQFSTEYGTLALRLSGTGGALKPYAELKQCSLSCTGSNVVDITSTTALFSAGWTAFTNNATTGNGINIATGSVIGVFNSVFVITAGASNYVVTGAVGGVYYSLNNSYSNATGVPYETKVNANISQFLYSSSIPSAITALTGDVTASGTGSQAATVARIQGRNVSSTAPTNGQVLAWNGTAWTPTAAGGTGTVTSVGVSGGTTGLTTSGGPVTSSGTITLAGTLNVANGGTGATTANSALNALLPSQASNNGKVLTTDGANTSWTTVGGGSGTVTSVGVSGGATGLTTSGGPVTSSGTITLAGTLALANGGTGATTQSGAANAVLPSQATNSGKFLTTDGSNVSWATAGGGSATPTNRQVFLSTGTWNKPTGAKSVLIRSVSNGFGGGAGTRGLPGKVAFGGSGGASGVFTEIQYDAATLPSSLSITIPTAPAGGYASFFCNNISTFPPNTATTRTDARSGNRTYATTFKFSSGGGAAAFLASLSTGGTGVGATSNDGGGSNGSVTTTLNLSASGGGGGQNSNSTGTALQGRYLFDTMFTASVSAPITDFITPTNNACPSWSGAFNGNSTSGGGGGITAADRATGGSGSNGGGWIAPVTLTNVATTSGTSAVTCASTTGLKVGMSIPDLVTSTGSTNSVQVSSIIDATTFNMNVVAASTASGLTVVAAVGAAGGGGGGASIQSSTPILITGVNLTSGSTTVDCTSTRGILPGMTIFNNANIPAGTTVASLVSETQFTISAAATGSGTGGKLVVAGAGTISGLSVTSGSGTVTATSTLGLKWGQAICTTGSTVGTHLNPSTSATRLNHVAAVTSGTTFVVSGTAGSTGSGLSATVINTVGFLSGVSCTANSPIVTVSDTTPLYQGMLVQIGTQGTWTTTAGSGATLAAAFTTGSFNKFLGDGVVESPSSASSSGTAVAFVNTTDVVASVTGTYFSTRMASSGNALPEVPTSGTQTQTGYSYARILSVDSATQITLDVNATGTYSNETLMYAFTGGHGGRGSSGAVEIITYF